VRGPSNGVAAYLSNSQILLTVKEVAAKLRVHPQTVHNYVTRGLIPALKIGGVWRINSLQLDRFIEEAGLKAEEKQTRDEWLSSVTEQAIELGEQAAERIRKGAPDARLYHGSTGLGCWV
jgi:excisionase family DNA binding protein